MSVQLRLDSVRFGYPGRGDFLGPVSMEVTAGQRWAIVGPNGAGKSTLLRLMAGLLRPTGGRIRIADMDNREIRSRDRARWLALLPQHPPHDLPITAREVVLMGRFPHRSLGMFESPGDHLAAERAMRTTGILELADRPIATLSGGEAQRVHLAAAIAQNPKVLLLDEPTASLDLQHQLTVLRILTDLAAKESVAVIMVNHDVNQALRFCSDAILLHRGQPVASGKPDSVLTPEVLRPVYGVSLADVCVPTRPDLRFVVATGSDIESDA